MYRSWSVRIIKRPKMNGSFIIRSSRVPGKKSLIPKTRFHRELVYLFRVTESARRQDEKGLRTGKKKKKSTTMTGRRGERVDIRIVSGHPADSAGDLHFSQRLYSCCCCYEYVAIISFHCSLDRLEVFFSSLSLLIFFSSGTGWNFQRAIQTMPGFQSTLLFWYFRAHKVREKREFPSHSSYLIVLMLWPKKVRMVGRVNENFFTHEALNTLIQIITTRFSARSWVTIGWLTRIEMGTWCTWKLPPVILLHTMKGFQHLGYDKRYYCHV